MTKNRRHPSDYEEESWRYEDWLMANEGKSVNELRNVNELIDSLEKWLRSIDVYGKHAVNFATPIIQNILARTEIDDREPERREIEIIKDFKIRRTGKKWMQGETGFIERNYIKKNVSVNFIAEETGRSLRSIYNKAYKLGLKRPKNARRK